MWGIEWTDPWIKGKQYADTDSKQQAERIRYGLKTTGADHVRIWEIPPEVGK